MARHPVLSSSQATFFALALLVGGCSVDATPDERITLDLVAEPDLAIIPDLAVEIPDLAIRQADAAPAPVLGVFECKPDGVAIERSGPEGLNKLSWPTTLATGDLDGDGRVDLVVSGQTGYTGVFLSRTQPAGWFRYSVFHVGAA